MMPISFFNMVVVVVVMVIVMIAMSTVVVVWMLVIVVTVTACSGETTLCEVECASRSKQTSLHKHFYLFIKGGD